MLTRSILYQNPPKVSEVSSMELMHRSRYGDPTDEDLVLEAMADDMDA
jgi:hypothetical protein